jgi:hypothetical protein
LRLDTDGLLENFRMGVGPERSYSKRLANTAAPKALSPTKKRKRPPGDRGVTSWELAEDEAPHSIVRPPDHRAGSSSDRDTEGSTTDVAMSGVQSSESTDGEVVLGVDTHLDFHVAAALDHLGRRLGEVRVPTTTKGYERLLCRADEFGVVNCAGVEGTSNYGAGLARYT